MNWSNKFSKLAALAILCYLPAQGVGSPGESSADGAGDSLTFVYVHGFGGVKEDPKFCQNLERFLEQNQAPATVMNYPWDSVEVDPLRPEQSWLKSQAMADLEAARFQREVLQALEREERRYVLVGFSVGTRVLLKSLEATTTELKGLRGVYFLGSAITRDSSLENRSALPEGMQITNFHSPRRDFVHRLAFNSVSEVPPGGQLGFDDEELFENLAVACAHTHKGVGIATDYSGLAEAIAFLELHEAGVEMAGQTKLNWDMPVLAGDFWWNRIATKYGVQLEQHSMRPGYYRAVRTDAEGKHTRVARGENLHAILKQIAASK